MVFETLHKKKIYLSVLVLFTLMVPPLVLINIHLFHRQQKETLQLYRQDLVGLIDAAALTHPDTASMKLPVTALAASEEQKSRAAFLKTALLSALVFLTGGLCTALATTIFVVRRLVSPLLSLCGQIRQMAADPEHSGRINMEKGGEFGEIAAEFNRHKELLQEKDRQLFQAQQMELTGLLAGGMAHEFNTVLTSIIGFAEIIQRTMPQEDPLCQHLDHILNAAARGSHLTRALLPFHRNGLIHPVQFDINSLVLDVQNQCSKVVGDAIRLQVETAPFPLIVMGDHHYLHQVLLNLINNARDAIVGNGTISMAVAKVEVDKDYSGCLGHDRPGPYVMISVSDSGCGIEDGIINKVLQPFFTTKDVGEGTGLGLTIAYGIIREHKGFMDIKSVPEKGTDISIHLPLIQP